MTLLGAAIKMDHFQPSVDPRKQELLEARFLGARVSVIQLPFFFHSVGHPLKFR